MLPVREAGCNFPSFPEGLSLRRVKKRVRTISDQNFPSFLEGLSLRFDWPRLYAWWLHKFPFLFGGTFIEAHAATA